MTFLHWTADLDTGIEEIDQQHKQLVDCINALYDAHHSGSRERMAQAIAELVDCTVAHFAFEELLLEQSDYPLFAAHARLHHNFIQKITALQSRFAAGEAVGQEFLDLMETWLFVHIRRNDHGYVEPLKKVLAAMQ